LLVAFGPVLFGKRDVVCLLVTASGHRGRRASRTVSRHERPRRSDDHECLSAIDRQPTGSLPGAVVRRPPAVTFLSAVVTGRSPATPVLPGSIRLF
jgi:hypothetical protein